MFLIIIIAVRKLRGSEQRAVMMMASSSTPPNGKGSASRRGMEMTPLSMIREIRASLKQTATPPGSSGASSNSMETPPRFALQHQGEGVGPSPSDERVRRYLANRGRGGSPSPAKTPLPPPPEKVREIGSSQRRANVKSRTPLPSPPPPPPLSTHSHSPSQSQSTMSPSQERTVVRKLRDLVRAHNRFQRYTEDRRRLPHSLEDLRSYEDPDFVFTLLRYARGQPIKNVSSPRRRTKRNMDDSGVDANIAALAQCILEASEESEMKECSPSSPQKRPVSDKKQRSPRPHVQTLCEPMEQDFASETPQENDDGDYAGDGSISVSVRVRPLLPQESSAGARSSVFVASGGTVHVDMRSSGEKDKTFAFDRVFDSSGSQETVYAAIGKPMVRHAQKGLNCSLIAYGQTGSGKTYSVMGPWGGQRAISGVSSSDGVLPRLCRDLFAKLRGNLRRNVSIKASYVELYNETLQDLLAPHSNVPLSASSQERRKRGAKKEARKLCIRESPATGVFVDGLTHHLITSEAEVHQILVDGSVARAVASTRKNATSSRSHTIFTFDIVQETKERDQIESRSSRIRIVDLAGSESAGIHEVPSADADIHQKRTRGRARSTYERRIKETASINKSLFMLGRLVSLLSENKASAHVPYRSSSLTWLLKDSLGGNALTSIIATVSPCASDATTTISTLTYASRAKTVRTSPRANVSVRARKESELRAEIEALKAAVAETKKMKALRRRVSLQHGSATGENAALAARYPHLIQITEDPMLVGAIVHVLRPGTTDLGRAVELSDAASGAHAVTLQALGVKDFHCAIENRESDGCFICAKDDDGIVALNGEAIATGTPRGLESGAIIVIGSTSVFMFREATDSSSFGEIANVSYGAALARVLSLKASRDADETRRRKNTSIFGKSAAVLGAVKKLKRGLPRARLKGNVVGALDDVADVNEMLREIAEASGAAEAFVVRCSAELRAPVDASFVSKFEAREQSGRRKRAASVFDAVDPKGVVVHIVGTLGQGGDAPVTLFSCTRDHFEDSLIFEVQKLHEDVVLHAGDSGGIPPEMLLKRFFGHCNDAKVQWTSEARELFFSQDESVERASKDDQNNPASLLDPEDDAKSESAEAYILKQEAQIRALQRENERLEDALANAGAEEEDPDAHESPTQEILSIDTLASLFSSRLQRVSDRCASSFEKGFREDVIRIMK